MKYETLGKKNAQSEERLISEENIRVDMMGATPVLCEKESSHHSGKSDVKTKYTITTIDM